MLDSRTHFVYIVIEHKECTRGDEILNSKVIAEKLTKLRGEKSRSEVANALGISISALSMYENGERIPRDDIKIKIANYYGKTVEFIFFTYGVHEKCTSEK